MKTPLISDLKPDPELFTIEGFEALVAEEKSALKQSASQ